MTSQRTIFKNFSKAGLAKRVDDYFDDVKKRKGVASMTGLALHLGCTRKNILDYQHTDEFGEILQTAKLRCENVLEEKMISGAPPTGMIFILKNNYGWNDKVEIDQTINGTLSLSALFDRAAQQKAIEGKKEEIIDGEIVETKTEELLFDSHEELSDELF